MKFLLAILFTVNAYAYNPSIRIDFEVEKSTPSTDILFIIDNSGSMADNQRTLRKLAKNFLGGLGETSFQITAISTDRSDPLQEVILTNNTSNVLFEFEKLMEIFGDTGDPSELVFSRLIDFSRVPFSSLFMRKGNPLEVVVLTDEPEQSDRMNIYVSNVLARFKEIDKKLHVSSIIPVVENGECDSNTSPLPGFMDEFFDIAKLTSGNIIDLCAKGNSFKSEYTQLARDIAARAAKVPTIPIKSYQFKEVISFDSLEVSYGSQIIPAGHLNEGWVYNSDENTIYFGDHIKLDQNQPVEAKFSIKYDVLK